MYNNSTNSYMNQNGLETLRAIPFNQKPEMLSSGSRLDTRKVPSFIPSVNSNSNNRALSLNKSGQVVNNFASRFVDIQEKFYVEEQAVSCVGGGSEAASVCSSLSSSFSSISPTSTPLSYEAARVDAEAAHASSEDNSPYSSSSSSSLSSSASSLSPHPLFTLANKEPVWSSLLYTPNLHPSLFTAKNDEAELKLLDSTFLAQSTEFNPNINQNLITETNSYNYNYYPNEYPYYSAQAEYYPSEYEEAVYYYDSNSYQEFYPEMNQDISKPVYNNNAVYNNQSYPTDPQVYYEGSSYYNNYNNRNFYPGATYQYNKSQYQQQHYNQHQYQAASNPNFRNSEERSDQFYEEMSRKVNDIVDNEAMFESNTNVDLYSQSIESYDAKFRSIPEFYPNHQPQHFYNKNQFVNEQSNYKNYQVAQFVPGYSNKPVNYQVNYEASNNNAEFSYQENAGFKKNLQTYSKPGVYYAQPKQQQQQTIQQQQQTQLQPTQQQQQQTTTNNYTKRGKNNVNQMKQRKKYCKCAYNCACGSYAYAANEGGASASGTNSPTNTPAANATQYQTSQNSSNNNNTKYRYRAVSKSRA